MDVNEVREGTILIVPVKVPQAGIYVGDVHAMMGDGEIAGHTTDVSAEVILEVRVIKGLTLEGPLLLPHLEGQRSPAQSKSDVFPVLSKLRCLPQLLYCKN